MVNSPTYLRGLLTGDETDDSVDGWNSTWTSGPPPCPEESSSIWTDGDNLKYFLIGCVILAAVCFCARPRIPHPELRRGARIRQLARERARQRERQGKFKGDPALRNKAIQQQLMVQQIKQVSEHGHLALGEPTEEGEGDAADGSCEADHSSEEISEATLEDDDRNEEETCVICLEPFRLGDAVAWSRKGSQVCEAADNKGENNNKDNKAGAGDEICQHVFHQECIESWLQKQDDCPYCRTILLHSEPTDIVVAMKEESSETAEPSSSRVASDELQQDDSTEAGGGKPRMSFVIINGLVARVRHAMSSMGHPSHEFSSSPSQNSSSSSEQVEQQGGNNPSSSSGADVRSSSAIIRNEIKSQEIVDV